MNDEASPTHETPVAKVPECTGRARQRQSGFARLQAAASVRGGQLLDVAFTKSQVKYRCRCARGHEWSGWGHLVLAGRWCPQCASIDKRLSIETMHETAHVRGGRCLSDGYLGCRIALTWECKFGHVWEALPHKVRNSGTWCPHCYRSRAVRSATRGNGLDLKSIVDERNPS